MREEKKALYNKIEEIKDKIVALTMEEEVTRDLLRELLNTKAELDHEPVLLNIGEVKDEKSDVFRGKEYGVVRTDRGILYHEYGGYSIFVAPNNTVLYDTLECFLEDRSDEEGISKEEKEEREARNEVLSFAIGVPRLIFFSVDTTISVTQRLMDSLDKAVKEAEDAALEDEDIEENEAFREATLELERLKKEV